MRRSAEGDVISSLLLETDPGGRFLHTELSTAAGLLTLHPEGDGTLHGNAVVSAESVVEHVRGLPWDTDAVPLLHGSVVCLAAAIDLIGRSQGPFSWIELPAVVIDLDLKLEARAVVEHR